MAQFFHVFSAISAPFGLKVADSSRRHGDGVRNMMVSVDSNVCGESTGGGWRCEEHRCPCVITSKIAPTLTYEHADMSTVRASSLPMRLFHHQTSCSDCAGAPESDGSDRSERASSGSDGARTQTSGARQPDYTSKRCQSTTNIHTNMEEA
jgi:hypothetical protein